MRRWALTNGTILTGSAAGRIDGTVVFRDGVIEAVVPTLPDVARLLGPVPNQIDVGGMTVMPGMIDCHVHLFLSGDLDAAASRDYAVATAAARAKQHLTAGVTTVRDLGGPVPQIFELRDNLAARTVVGPRVMTAGSILTTPRGHGWFLGTEIRTRHQMVTAVRKAARRGVDCIKIAISGGASTENSDLFCVQFSEDDVRACVETAHELGLHVAAHASNPESIRIGAAAGVDSIEHAVMIDDAALQALVAGRTVVVPTLAATAMAPEALQDSRVPSYVREKAAVTLPVHRSSIGRVVAAGVTVAGGTDAGSTLTAHGETPLEAELLVECGLSTTDAIAAITWRAARLLRTEDRLGTVEDGKVADLVVVAGDPEEDIRCLRDVRLVIQSGEVVHAREPFGYMRSSEEPASSP